MVIGKNSVPVLATLFLLSYAKLFQSIINILSYSVLEYSDGRKFVWSVDGNLDYLGHQHAPLFGVGIVVLFLLWLPYTLILLLGQWINKCNYNLINPRRACAARVTVVGSVCLSVCLSVKSHLTYGVSVRPEIDVTYSADNEGGKICGVFSETAPLQRSGTSCIVCLCAVGHFPAESAHAHCSIFLSATQVPSFS